jgi:hypothetical protein
MPLLAGRRTSTSRVLDVALVLALPGSPRTRIVKVIRDRLLAARLALQS